MSHDAKALIYLLCFVTSVICTWLLARRYRASGAHLLLWTALCFAFLAVNNLLVVADILIFPTYDLGAWRQAAGLAAVCVLLFGFVWEAE